MVIEKTVAQMKSLRGDLRAGQVDYKANQLSGRAIKQISALFDHF